MGEVEAVLDEMPEVQKAIVFSVPSALWGEEVGCAYQLHGGAPKDKEAEKAFVTSMKAFCKENGVAGYKVPAYNVFPAKLPMTQTKKSGDAKTTLWAAVHSTHRVPVCESVSSDVWKAWQPRTDSTMGCRT